MYVRRSVTRYLNSCLPADRMPQQLGRFIGKHVYNGKLKTDHPGATQCCRFVDVKNSKEVKKQSSWINQAEIMAVVREARNCTNKGRSYRIVTPYDAQRGMLEAALKREKGLSWEDKVFCVDSFQGTLAAFWFHQASLTVHSR
ncbi:hypothetical protein B0H16DRAFT_148788 [Mycena metata]|uniref:DNA2/NAM7 helicase-like C-terminal domain-containing protein n=1 Tax=Mycena metata TaxID=1033252 RepID=A0AAD7JYY7_9AGAR|nr:hypothetical protein B0H16DRAFT_148788 [Mycena metata]